LGGFTLNFDADTIFDTATWSEAAYKEQLQKVAGTTPVVMNWLASAETYTMTIFDPLAGITRSK
jgi:RNase adaptor protein for sRNA GlmZ degradation